MYTYYIKSPYIDEKILTNRGNWRKYKQNEKKVDFLMIEKSETTEGLSNFYDKHVGIENSIDINIARLDKYSFIENFLKIPTERKYVPDQVALTPKKLSNKAIKFANEKKECLVKPVNASKGIGIFHVSSGEELKKKFWKINKTYNPRQRQLKQKNKIHWLLQEYIDDPMLYKGYKFHIRTYYIVTSDGQQFLSKKSYLMTAKKKYKKGNYNDLDIHDTHFDKNKEIIFGEKTLEGFTLSQYRKMKEDIIEIHKTFISKINNVVCYDNTDLCYIILGVDIMFTNDGQVKVLELNSSPGMQRYKMNISNYLLEGIMQEIVDKKFPPKNKLKINNHLIKL